MKHILKIQKKFHDRIIEGEKVFEIRENDRDFQCGDIIQFKVEDDRGKFIHQAEKFKIGYVLNYFEGLNPAFVAFSIFPLNGDES